MRTRNLLRCGGLQRGDKRTNPPRDALEYDLAAGFEQVSQLLEDGSNSIPESERLGQQAVGNRSRTLIERGDGREYWEGETESLRELMGQHEFRA